MASNWIGDTRQKQHLQPQNLYPITIQPTLNEAHSKKKKKDLSLGYSNVCEGGARLPDGMHLQIYGMLQPRCPGELLLVEPATPS